MVISFIQQPIKLNYNARGFFSFVTMFTLYGYFFYSTTSVHLHKMWQIYLLLVVL